jgi:hypothetical protein
MTLDFGLTGPSIPQATSDGSVKIAAIEAVRIPRIICRRVALCFSARAETMFRSAIISSSYRSKTDPGDGREAHGEHESVQRHHPVLPQPFLNARSHPSFLSLVALLS